VKLRLVERARSKATVTLAATLPPMPETCVVKYGAPAGALLRVDGRAAGAFDLEHHEVVLPPATHARELHVEVELRSLPTNGLPAGPGLWWTWINRRAASAPRRTIGVVPSVTQRPRREQNGDVPLWGHSHLDVAWLWSYEQTKRKAARTFVNALDLLDADAEFVFMQSQPQLYEFVRSEDNELFERVAYRAGEGRFDPDVAALWVEPDCNIPSGESLLRQMLFAHRFCVEHFGIEPSIAWLPDTFGFARTLPTLLAHAGIRYFATTKLGWNDTNPFPYAQFRWRGPDGSEIVAASIAGMDCRSVPGGLAQASARHEPLVIGYGDGGGGPTRAQVDEASSGGRWERPRRWFERLAARRDELPVHDDELYLEYHRGVFTTHRDVKAQNAWLERRLRDAEELAAWCVAVRAPADALQRVRSDLHAAWEIVLRNQFHDVLPGTSIAEVYADAAAEYQRAHQLVESAAAAAQAMLPRASRERSAPRLQAPQEVEGDFVFANDFARARLRPTGTLVELVCARGGRNLVAQANLLAWYRDRPKRWEAWNVDDGYQRSRRPAKPGRPRIVDGALEIPFDIDTSRATMRVALAGDEPFLRVDLAVDWRERRKFLRLENWLAVEAECVRYGAPHGSTVRSARTVTPYERARFEVPGQRFASVDDGQGSGVAVLALDTYGWNARVLERGGVQVGHSLLRSTTWPDPNADRGEQALSWAFAPLSDPSVAQIERLWLRFAGSGGVRLFQSEEPAVIVVACKPAEDGDGVIVRVRECDGAAHRFSLRCGGRIRGAVAVDGLERPIEGDLGLEGESLIASIDPFALRTFRVRF
jgi:alpha-mannosidase